MKMAQKFDGWQLAIGERKFNLAVKSGAGIIPTLLLKPEYVARAPYQGQMRWLHWVWPGFTWKKGPA